MMKWLAVLVLVALVSVAFGKPCADCIIVKEGDEEFNAAVHLLNRTLANLAGTSEGPFFRLVQAYSIAILPYYLYPTVTADLQDHTNKVQRCDVTIFKPLDFEDRTNEFKVTFDCEQFQSTRNVIFNY